MNEKDRTFFCSSVLLFENDFNNCSQKGTDSYAEQKIIIKEFLKNRLWLA